MNIIFYNEELVNTQNERIKKMKNIEEGNPGIGGTEFLFLALPYYLKKFYKTKGKFYLMMNSKNKTNAKGLDIIYVENFFEAIKKSEEINADYFVFKPSLNQLEDILNTKTKLNFISWHHNFENKYFFEKVNKIKNLKFAVFVSKIHKMLIPMNYDLFKKSFFIHNGVEKRKKFKKIKASNKKNIVTFIGSLTSTKNFHILAKNWKNILNNVPDAKLYVIGTGNLYRPGQKMGKWKISDEEYEKIWRPYLSDNKNQKLDSVKFFGVLGKDKHKLIQKSKVVVVNPTAYGETFCLSAVEAQTVGTPCVSANKYGLTETVQNKKTGLLSNNEKEFEQNIIKLLKDNELNDYLGANGIKFSEKKFNWHKISKEWIDLFNKTKNDENKKLQYIESKLTIIDDIIKKSLNSPKKPVNYIKIILKNKFLKN